MDEPATLDAGSLFAGDFRVLSLLDQGGMGSVYLTEQVSTGQRRALKLMHDRFSTDPSMRRRFIQEARVASLIRSAHVVQVIGAGVDEPTGCPWIAMEYLEGTTLDRRYPAGSRIDWGEIRLIMAQLCHALGAAHGEGIVHRDVKPENIFLAKAHIVGVPHLVKLLDFGIAKVLSEVRGGGTMVLGSPCWMAPEQLNGRQPVSAAADVWALGLLAFRLFTGRLYWNSAQDEQPGLLPIIQELSARVFEPPTRRARALGLTTPLPAGFDGWFARCVAHDPQARFPDATAAAAAFHALWDTIPALGATLASGSVPSPPSSPLRAPSSPLRSPPSSPRRVVLRFKQGRRSEDFLDAHGADLSIEGFWLRSASPLAPGTPIQLEILVANDLHIATGAGVIDQIAPGRMFLRFSSLSGPLVDALAARDRPREGGG